MLGASHIAQGPVSRAPRPAVAGRAPENRTRARSPPSRRHSPTVRLLHAAHDTRAMTLRQITDGRPGASPPTTAKAHSDRGPGPRACDPLLESSSSGKSQGLRVSLMAVLCRMMCASQAAYLALALGTKHSASTSGSSPSYHDGPSARGHSSGWPDRMILLPTDKRQISKSLRRRSRSINQECTGITQSPEYFGKLLHHRRGDGYILVQPVSSTVSSTAYHARVIQTFAATK